MDFVSVGEVLGNYGEFVGAIAVVVTLVFLTVQLRQNTKATHAQTAQHVFHSSTEFFDTLTEPNRARIWQRMVIDGGEPSEDPSDPLIARTLIRSVMTLYDNEYFHYQQGGLDDEVHDSYKQRLLSILSYPGVLSWWEASHDLFRKSFRAYVESLIREHSLR